MLCYRMARIAAQIVMDDMEYIKEDGTVFPDKMSLLPAYLKDLNRKTANHYLRNLSSADNPHSNAGARLRLQRKLAERRMTKEIEEK